MPVGCGIRFPVWLTTVCVGAVLALAAYAATSTIATGTRQELESPLTDQSLCAWSLLAVTSSAALSVFGHKMTPLSSQIITDQCSNHGRLRAGWAPVRACSMVSKSPTRMSLCFVRHCPKLSAMTRNFPRGAFLSMSFVTRLSPAMCYFHQLQNIQNQHWV